MEFIFIIPIIITLIIGIISIIINPEVTFVFIVLIAGFGLFLIINSLNLFFINYSFII